jgi:polyisoprenoid-binding protein YceI
MKRMISLLAIPMMATSLLAAPSTAEIKGQANFVSEAPVEKIEGTGDATGALTLDLADLTSIKGNITVPVASMKTGNDTRDDHMRAAEWLDAAACPNIAFEAKGAKVVSTETKGDITEYALEVNGAFSVHCKSKDTTVKATLKVKGDKLKISSSFDIALADFDVKGKAGVVGEKVGKSIAIQVSLSGSVK